MATPNRSQDWLLRVWARYIEGDIDDPETILGPEAGSEKTAHERWTVSALVSLYQSLSSWPINSMMRSKTRVEASLRQVAHTLHLDPPGGW
jgi:hypothetical protein